MFNTKMLNPDDMDLVDARLTDEQLIASFTPMELHWYNWYPGALEKLHAESSDDRVHRARLRQWFPKDDVYKEFLSWSRLWNGRHMRRMRYRMPVNEYIDLIQQTRFDQPDSTGTFLWSMEMGNMPFIYLGTSVIDQRASAYGIQPGAYYLWPNFDPNPYEPGLLDKSVLAINFNVPIEVSFHRNSGGRPREQASSGNEFVEWYDGNPTATAGFTFVQIGCLCTFDGDRRMLEKLSHDGILNNTWDDTGFGVVVELSPDAKLGAVWVLYNFHQARPDEGCVDDACPGCAGCEDAPKSDGASEGRQHIRMYGNDGEKLRNVARLRGGELFTAAKIAGSLEELRKPRKDFGFNIKRRYECQIVRAKLFEGQIYRQFVNIRSHRKGGT